MKFSSVHRFLHELYPWCVTQPSMKLLLLEIQSRHRSTIKDSQPFYCSNHISRKRSVYVAIMTFGESPIKVLMMLNASSCRTDYSEMYPDHWVWFRLPKRIMGHVYMIVFWFHRICICTQYQNGVERGNEKDVKKK